MRKQLKEGNPVAVTGVSAMLELKWHLK